MQDLLAAQEAVWPHLRRKGAQVGRRQVVLPAAPEQEVQHVHLRSSGTPLSTFVS
jgi:hypothetical protein